MKSISILTIILLLSLTGLSQDGNIPDWATKKGSFGVGIHPKVVVNNSENDDGSFKYKYNQLGLGLSVNSYVTEAIRLSAWIGGQTHTETYNNVTHSSETEYKTPGFNIGVSVGKSINVISKPKGQLVITPRIGLNSFSGNETRRDNGTKIYEEKVTEVFPDIGANVEYFFRCSALGNMSIGCDLSAIGLDFDNFAGNKESGFNMFDSAEDFGNLSFNFWF